MERTRSKSWHQYNDITNGGFIVSNIDSAFIGSGGDTDTM